MTTLEPRAQEHRYTVAIAKGAAAINEIKTLLQCWVPGEDYWELRSRVQQSDVLGKTHRSSRG